MPQFVISHRRAGHTQPSDQQRALDAFHDALDQVLPTHAELVHADRSATSGPARHVALFNGQAGTLAALAQHPDLILEPVIQHHIGRARQADTGHVNSQVNQVPGNDNTLEIRVFDEQHRPRPDIDVIADYGHGRNRKQSMVITDASGAARISQCMEAPIHELAVAPAHQWWPMVFEAPADAISLQLMPLPDAQQHLGWWHKHSGIDRWHEDRGQGVRIGVIDSGLGAHSALGGIHDLGSLIDCTQDPDGGQDARGHGTHVCGAIAARPDSTGQFGGTAPAAAVYSIRVVGNSGSAHQADIALAIHQLVHEQRCHLINLSLGTTQRSELVADAVRDARATGCLVISASGNGNDAVEYPAALQECVAVGALGLDGWGPSGSLAAHRRPDSASRRAKPWFIANFSSHGPGLNAVAAGVGIISTVPGNHYAAYSGTSMAAPQLTGLLAAALHQHPILKASGVARSSGMAQLLDQYLVDLGLDRTLQGMGRISLDPS